MNIKTGLRKSEDQPNFKQFILFPPHRDGGNSSFARVVHWLLDHNHVSKNMFLYKTSTSLLRLCQSVFACVLHALANTGFFFAAAVSRTGFVSCLKEHNPFAWLARPRDHTIAQYKHTYYLLDAGGFQFHASF